MRVNDRESLRERRIRPKHRDAEQIARVLGVGLDAFFSNQDPAEPTTANLRHHLCDIAYQADEISLKEIVGAAKRIPEKSSAREIYGPVYPIDREQS